MGNIIVSGILFIVIALVILSLIRRHKQGKSIFCDGVSCSACGAHSICQSHRLSDNKLAGEEKKIRFFKH